MTEADAPRSAEAAELDRLAEAELEIDAKLSQLGVDERQAAEDATRLAAELVELERRAATGAQVTAKERTAAEDALAAARGRAGAPWAERRTALLAVRRERAGETQTFAIASFAALLEEREQRSLLDAEGVDVVARQILDAVAVSERSRQHVEQLVQLVRGRTEFGDVLPSRADGLVKEAERLLAEGGERPAMLRDQLRPTSTADVDVDAEPAHAVPA